MSRIPSSIERVGAYTGLALALAATAAAPASARPVDSGASKAKLDAIARRFDKLLPAHPGNKGVTCARGILTYTATVENPYVPGETRQIPIKAVNPMVAPLGETALKDGMTSLKGDAIGHIVVQPVTPTTEFTAFTKKMKFVPAGGEGHKIHLFNVQFPEMTDGRLNYLKPLTVHMNPSPYNCGNAGIPDANGNIPRPIPTHP